MLGAWVIPYIKSWQVGNTNFKRENRCIKIHW